MKIKNEGSNAAQIKGLIQESLPPIKELKYGKDENAITVKVYPALVFTKRCEMIEEIVDGSFMGNKDFVTTYAPEYLTLLQRYTVVKYYTDLALPDELNDLWSVLKYTPIFDDVAEAVGKDEINDIFDAANKAIDTRRQYLATKSDTNAFVNKIGDTISDFVDKINSDDLSKIISEASGEEGKFSLQGILGSLLSNS